jgi:hypothetical protein
VRVVSTKLRISSIYYGVASGGMFRCMAVISCQRTLSGHVCHLHLFKVYQSLSLAFSGSATSHGSILCFSGLSTLFSRTQSLSDQYIILGDIPHFLKHHTLYAAAIIVHVPSHFFYRTYADLSIAALLLASPRVIPKTPVTRSWVIRSYRQAVRGIFHRIASAASHS